MSDSTLRGVRRGWPRWRRPVLLLSASSLLALGVVLNVETGEEEPAEDAPADATLIAQAPTAPRLPESEEDRSGAEATVSEEREADDSGARHKGEEGRMGKAQQKDEDVWGGLTGTEVGEAYGVGGLGLVGTGRGGGGVGEGTIGLGNVGIIGKGSGSGTGRGYGGGPFALSSGHFLASGEGYAQIEENRWVRTAEDARSTFSIDVDTASYSNVRRFLQDQMLPPADAVRIEELVNYFAYDYPEPETDVPFSVVAEVGPCPWNAEHRLVHVGLQGKVIEPEDLPSRNLVFLIDVSGSMSSPSKLPLVKRSLAALVEQLDTDDRISLVVYAGAAGTVLPPTPGSDKATILDALERLSAGGSTNGGAGIQQAYDLARASFVDGGINRVILATDGDFNVGVSSRSALVKLIERERRSGVFLSVLGYGMGNLQDATMEQLADKGNGNYAYIDGIAEARKVLVEEAGATLVTIAKDVKIQVQFDPDRVQAHRLVGYENRVLAHHEFEDDTKDAGEIGAGHTVTALYEIAPGSVRDSEPIMQLKLRYKQPDGDTSQALSFEVEDPGQELLETSEDFRFSAAVASFGLLLRESKQAGEATWAKTQALAMGALGPDPMCRRHELVELLQSAARLKGERLPEFENACSPDPRRGKDEPMRTQNLEPTSEEPADPSSAESETSPSAAAVIAIEAQADDEGPHWLEVLRLLPPLLAFPMFVLAWRDPYRRRREQH